MAYPYGMKYSRLTFSQPLTVSGLEADNTKITITPTRRVVWRDNGRPVYAFTETVQAAKGQPGGVTAPYVDQPGFRDDAGNQLTGWAYRVVRAAEFEGQTQIVEKMWPPLVGQETVDFDLLPSADQSTPTTVKAAEMVSVAGATVVVTTNLLAERLEPLDRSQDRRAARPAHSGRGQPAGPPFSDAVTGP